MTRLLKLKKRRYKSFVSALSSVPGLSRAEGQEGREIG